MELWIRSQDKMFFGKVEQLRIVEQDYKTFNIFNENRNCLGTYDTKERATEILNTIEDIKKPFYIIQSEKIFEKAYGRGFIEFIEEVKPLKLRRSEFMNDDFKIYALEDSNVYEMPEE